MDSDSVDNQTPSLSPPSDAAIFRHETLTGNVGEQIMELIRKQGEQFQSSMNTLKDDLTLIKTDIGHVRKRCDHIDQRCEKLESDNEKLFDFVRSTTKDMEHVMRVTKENNSSVNKLCQKIDTIEEELDRLEEFSRKNNLRMFRVPPLTENKENYDDCAEAVVDILNKSKHSKKKWVSDDIARAHRVGSSKDDQPKTMIVKFTNWRDKIALITDRENRDSLEKETGVRLANDLTRRQAAIVTEAKKEGKAAFFKGGKLHIGPRRPDSRSYAQVVAVNNTEKTQHNNTPRAKSRDENNSDDQHEEGDSPRQASTSKISSRQPQSTRASRDNNSPTTGQRQPELTHFLRKSVHNSGRDDGRQSTLNKADNAPRTRLHSQKDGRPTSRGQKQTRINDMPTASQQ